MQAVHLAEGHEQNSVMSESYNFGLKRGAVALRLDQADVPQPDVWTVSLDDQSGDSGHAPGTFYQGCPLNAGS
jgi:hypothetical protein